MVKNTENVIAYLKNRIIPILQNKFGTELKATYETISGKNYVDMQLFYDFGEVIGVVPFTKANPNGETYLNTLADVLTRKSGLEFRIAGTGLTVRW